MTGQVLLQEAHAEADPEAPKPAVNEVAAHDAKVAPGADKDSLAGEVTPAAVDSTAASGDPIGEAVVALQEVMEPAPAPEPAREGESFYFLMESISCWNAHICPWAWLHAAQPHLLGKASLDDWQNTGSGPPKHRTRNACRRTELLRPPQMKGR